MVIDLVTPDVGRPGGPPSPGGPTSPGTPSSLWPGTPINPPSSLAPGTPISPGSAGAGKATSNYGVLSQKTLDELQRASDALEEYNRARARPRMTR